LGGGATKASGTGPKGLVLAVGESKEQELLDGRCHIRLGKPRLELSDLLIPSLPARGMGALEHMFSGLVCRVAHGAGGSIPAFPAVHCDHHCRMTRCKLRKPHLEHRWERSGGLID